jgi:hypothetical protein
VKGWKEENSDHKIPGPPGWWLFGWASSPFKFRSTQCYKNPKGSCTGVFKDKWINEER